MKVLHLVPALLGPNGIYGGAERYALELARAMARRVPTRLASFSPGSGALEAGGLEIVACRNWLPERRFAGSPVGPGLLRHLAWADVIHCHQPHTMGASLALLYTRLFRKPIFATDHNGGGLSLQSFVDTEVWYSGHLWVSEFARRLRPLRAADPVIWGGVDAHRFHPDPARSRSQEVVFVGRLIAAKGLECLVQAVPATTPLVLIGPPAEPELLNRLRRLAVGKPVRFLPPGDDATILPAYQRALCVVLPSIELPPEAGRPAAVPEVLGLVLLEAMACGTPVICSRLGGMPEIVADGETGFIVPPGDVAALREKILWLQAHPEAAERMGQAARARVLERFTWDAVAGRCLAAYSIAASTVAGAKTRHKSAGSISTR